MPAERDYVNQLEKFGGLELEKRAEENPSARAFLYGDEWDIDDFVEKQKREQNNDCGVEPETCGAELFIAEGIYDDKTDEADGGESGLLFPHIGDAADGAGGVGGIAGGVNHQKADSGKAGCGGEHYKPSRKLTALYKVKHIEHSENNNKKDGKREKIVIGQRPIMANKKT